MKIPPPPPSPPPRLLNFRYSHSKWAPEYKANETKHNLQASHFRGYVSVCGGVLFKIELSSSQNFIQHHFLCRYGSGSGQIWLNYVGCAGSEECLVSCSNQEFDAENCTHSDDVALSCFGTRVSSSNCSSVGTTDAPNCRQLRWFHLILRPFWPSGYNTPGIARR